RWWYPYRANLQVQKTHNEAPPHRKAACVLSASAWSIWQSSLRSLLLLTHSTAIAPAPMKHSAHRIVLRHQTQQRLARRLSRTLLFLIRLVIALAPISALMDHRATSAFRCMLTGARRASC